MLQQVKAMHENYKITKEIALRILELRNSGLTYPKISAQIKSEFDVDVFRSSIERFYKNFLKGKSRILPKEEISLEVRDRRFIQPVAKQYIEQQQEPLAPVKKAPIDSSDNPLLNQLSTKKSLTRATRPSDELLSFYQPKK